MNPESGPTADPETYTARPRQLSVERRADHVYRDMKQRLLEGEFPLGQRLGEERLGTMLGVSRTPVREALSRLHAEGLVRRDPRGGYSPSVPDLDLIHELYEVRRMLELGALGNPSAEQRRGGHDSESLRALVGEWTELACDGAAPESGAEFVLLDEDFHIRLAQASGNRPCAEMLGLVNGRIRIVRMHDFLTPERVEATIAEHLAVAKAVLAGDTALAAELLAEHLAQSMAVVEQRAASAIARMVTRSALGVDS